MLMSRIHFKTPATVANHRKVYTFQDPHFTWDRLALLPLLPHISFTTLKRRLPLPLLLVLLLLILPTLFLVLALVLVCVLLLDTPQRGVQWMGGAVDWGSII